LSIYQEGCFIYSLSDQELKRFGQEAAPQAKAPVLWSNAEEFYVAF
jgi:hypothetical protein